MSGLRLRVDAVCIQNEDGGFFHPLPPALVVFECSRQMDPGRFAVWKERKEVKEMNTLVIVLIAAVCLLGAYTFYGRWLANKWGIDPRLRPPQSSTRTAATTSPPTAGPFLPISSAPSQVPALSPVPSSCRIRLAARSAVGPDRRHLLWCCDRLGALYASVKNDGKSMGMLIEKYIGKTGRKLFLLFCWLFCGIVIAAFADMVAGTFNAFGTDGALVEAAQTNGAAGMVSIMFMVFAIVFGLLQKKFNFSGWKESVISIVFIVLSFVIGANFPIILGKAAWSYITFIYIFFAAVLPMWLLKQPRDHMTTFMFVAMIAGAVVGLLVAHPTMNLPVFTGFTNEKLGTMFPILFVTVACGAVSGFHSLVSSGTSSKTVENEKDMLKVGYGAMILESLLAVLALCVAGAAAAADGTPAAGTPFQIFSRGVAGFFEMFGIPAYAATVFMTMCVSALALTSLDAVARIGRMSFQELFSVDDMEHAELAQAVLQRLLLHLHHAGVRLHPDQDRLRQHLAAVRFRQPAAERSGSGHPVRLPEGHRPQQQDALPPAGHHAVRHLHRAVPASDRDGQGHQRSRFGGHPCW